MTFPFKTQHKRSRLFLSFSGGKTSAYMTDRLLREYASHWDEVIVAFANTGQEHLKTLDYVEACDKQYGFNVVWLESVFSPIRGVGTKHRIVDHTTACRDGSIFKAMSEKHGIPNTQFPHCTRELKLYAIKSYLRSRGWKANTYNTAIGIRADEFDRMSLSAMRDGYIYPLIDLGITKDDVLAWELQQPVRLGIPEHHGNCVWCWKKSVRKLATVYREAPEAFQVARELEADFKDHGPGFGDRRLFRGRRTVEDIAADAASPDFVPYYDPHKWNADLDTGGGCSDSCEIGIDEATTTDPDEQTEPHEHD